MASELKLSFEFDRYVNGTLMAEGVTIERASTLDKAMVAAARIAPKGPNGETPVLVYRPAPAATDTGLVTVRTEYRLTRGSYVCEWSPFKQQPIFSDDKYETRELVTRSQAEELLAAERAEKEELDAECRVLAKRCIEKDARIKELEWKAHNATISNKIGEDSAPMLWSEYVEALEAKLAAAEKALEPFAKIPVSTVPEGRLGHVPDKHPCMFDLDGNVLFTASDIRKARAVLGGKPS